MVSFLVFFYFYLFYIEKEILTFAREDELILGEDIVTKTGITTGTTYGYLIEDSTSLKMEVSGVHFDGCNSYEIENIDDDDPFFLEGDSGSGVYVIKNGSQIKPLGIAYGYSESTTAVCNIREIVDELDLQIVRYF